MVQGGLGARGPKDDGAEAGGPRGSARGALSPAWLPPTLLGLSIKEKVFKSSTTENLFLSTHTQIRCRSAEQLPANGNSLYRADEAKQRDVI